MLGKIEGRRRRGQQRMRQLDSITNSMHMSLSKLQETVEDREGRQTAAHRVEKRVRHLSDWRTTDPWLQTYSLFFSLIPVSVPDPVKFWRTKSLGREGAHSFREFLILGIPPHFPAALLTFALCIKVFPNPPSFSSLPPVLCTVGKCS